MEGVENLISQELALEADFKEDVTCLFLRVDNPW